MSEARAASASSRPSNQPAYRPARAMIRPPVTFSRDPEGSAPLRGAAKQAKAIPDYSKYGSIEQGKGKIAPRFIVSRNEESARCAAPAQRLGGTGSLLRPQRPRHEVEHQALVVARRVAAVAGARVDRHLEILVGPLERVDQLQRVLHVDV